MAATQRLRGAHVILLAAQLCSDTKIEALRALRADRPEILSPAVICRIILTFLPEETEPSIYIPLLKDIQNGTESHDVEVDTSSVQEFSDAAARAQVIQLRLHRLQPSVYDHATGTDHLERFLIQRAHQIDAATSDVPAVLQLVEPFVDNSETLRTWLISRLVPLLRKDYEYYPENVARVSLREIEALQGSAGVDVLLQHAKEASS